ncbi:hypothetical protein FBU59_001900 [Linderina macrospora]|uniref:Uncharacterized protein n=1 Tax=Linderina macrospora TaxID=4868 RepID=A0ACC1JD01_9FUNG|nr:hypothetical protein FBU59_001900 [Linderina macrospora]
MPEAARTETPAEDELRAAIAAIKASNPDFGIARVLTTIRASHPTWQVSEKRVRKFLGSLGLVQTDSSAIPKSSLAPTDLAATTGKDLVEIRYINGTKGKGVFAKSDFLPGNIVFEETPFAWYPRWDTIGAAYHLDADHECQLCARSLDPLVVRARVRPVKCTLCGVKFCSNICKTEADAHFHKIECSKHNPAFAKFADFSRRQDQWGAPMGAVRALERVMMEFEASMRRGREAWAGMKAFATVGQETIDEKRFGSAWFMYQEDRENKWKTSYELMKKALCPPPAACGLKAFDKIPPKIKEEMFSYQGWLDLLGKYCLNDQNGGFYMLQSCFNHSCTPNCQVSHPNSGKYRAHIEVLKPIKEGEEMFITYVNPREGVESRRKDLREWYMFDCNCARCQKELEGVPKVEKQENVITL